MKIAPEHSECKRIGPGQNVIERFLLDRVGSHSGDVAERNAQLPVIIEPDFADTTSPRGDKATVSAGDTPDFIAFRIA